MVDPKACSIYLRGTITQVYEGSFSKVRASLEKVYALVLRLTLQLADAVLWTQLFKQHRA